MEDIEDASFNTQKLIVRTRLDLEPEFQEGRKKKSFLWGKVIAKIKEINPDFEMTREQTSRKFLNLQTTYRRIKNRNNSSGRNTSSWEFYDMFDEVYGMKHSSNPPVRNLQSSIYTIDEIADEGQEVKPFERLMDEPSCQKRPRITNENDILEFLKREAERDEERHKEVMEIERCKIKMDQERINAMIELKNVLQKMMEKSVLTFNKKAKV